MITSDDNADGHKQTEEQFEQLSKQIDRRREEVILVLCKVTINKDMQSTRCHHFCGIHKKTLGWDWGRIAMMRCTWSAIIFS